MKIKVSKVQYGSQSAYDAKTMQHLETMQPNQDYQFDGVDEILEIPKAQAGKSNRIHFDSNSGLWFNDAGTAYRSEGNNFIRVPVDQIRETAEFNQSSESTIEANKTPLPVGTFTDPAKEQIQEVIDKPDNIPFVEPVDKPKPSKSSGKSKSGQPTPYGGNTHDPAKPSIYPNYEKNEGFYTVRKGDWLSSIADQFNIPYDRIDELLKANPEIKNRDLIVPGQKIRIPEEFRPKMDGPADGPLPEMETISIPRDTKSADSSTDLGEDLTGYISDLHKRSALENKTREELRDVYGKLDRNIPTNALNAMMRANRTMQLPYRAETPSRTMNYVEEDPQVYLDEIDGSINQVIQQVNPNDAQGMSYMSNVLANADKQKRSIINRVNATNLQRRMQTDNGNTQLLNQYDMIDNQQRERYVDGVHQTLANLDRAKVQQGEYLDDMIVNDQRFSNFMVMEAMKYGNFHVDPETNEVYRTGTDFTPKQKTKYGLKKRK